MDLVLSAPTASEAVQQALSNLASQAPPVIAAALGVAVLIFGAKYLWRVAKGMSK